MGWLEVMALTKGCVVEDLVADAEKLTYMTKANTHLVLGEEEVPRSVWNTG